MSRYVWDIDQEMKEELLKDSYSGFSDIRDFYLETGVRASTFTRHLYGELNAIDVCGVAGLLEASGISQEDGKTAEGLLEGDVYLKEDYRGVGESQPLIISAGVDDVLMVDQLVSGIENLSPDDKGNLRSQWKRAVGNAREVFKNPRRGELSNSHRTGQAYSIMEDLGLIRRWSGEKSNYLIEVSEEFFQVFEEECRSLSESP